jgi:hypothetical protein
VAVRSTGDRLYELRIRSHRGRGYSSVVFVGGSVGSGSATSCSLFQNSLVGCVCVCVCVHVCVCESVWDLGTSIMRWSTSDLECCTTEKCLK